jgi:hypothetical protein
MFSKLHQSMSALSIKNCVQPSSDSYILLISTNKAELLNAEG